MLLTVRQPGRKNLRVFFYRAYGLTIGSDLEIPELASAASADRALPDVRVSLLGSRRIQPPSEWFHRCSTPDGEPFLACARIEGGYLLRYEGVADFIVGRSGREIVCARREPRVALSTLCHLLLDHVFPMALNFSGKEVLHATAIMTGRGACAFIGPTGSGKSTLAGIFLRAGHPLLADDCLVLEERARILATPAYPGLRLWTDAMKALSSESDRALRVAGHSSKARLLGPRASAGFPREPQPLAAVYRVIRDGGDGAAGRAPRVVAMGAREALIQLISSAFLLDTADRPALTRRFAFLGRLLTQVPVRQLFVPNDFSALPAARDAVLADLEDPVAGIGKSS
jgi:hypothetical protein